MTRQEQNRIVIMILFIGIAAMAWAGFSIWTVAR